jgi:hypothetical protein
MAFIDFNKWMAVLSKPADTFRKEKGSANLGEGAKHIVVAGIIAGFISGIVAALGLTAVGGVTGMAGLGAATGALAFVALLILTPIMYLIAWLVDSAIMYVFAKLLGGKGGFTQQSYLMALFIAPLMLLMSILSIIPFAGWILVLILGLYSLYLLTLALKEAHGYSTARAVLTWLIPVIIVVIVMALVAAAALMAFLALGGATPAA